MDHVFSHTQPDAQSSSDDLDRGDARGPCEIHVADGTGRVSPADQASLAGHYRRAIQELGLTGTMRVRIVADDEMARAHLEYLDVEGTTDVLTFDLREDPESLAMDLDVLVCLDEAMRQASACGHRPLDELVLYGVHAILHCLGHDDHDEAQAALMHAEEDRLLTAIGLGAVYARGTEPSP
jgi:probable rRNA maturation factor